MTDFDALWNFDDPAATEGAFRAILPEAEQTGGAVPLELLTQIARTLGLQRRFDEAHAMLDDVQSRLGSDMHRARIRYLLERGRVLNTSGRRDEAKPLFLEAWELGRTAGEDALAVDAAHMVAIVESGPASLEWNERAMELAERSTEPRARKWLGSLYNNIGWTYHDMGRHDDALQRFEQALTLREAQGAAGPIRIARWCVARCSRSLGRLEEALAHQQELRAESEASGDPDGYVYEEIAECLQALGRTTEATPAFARAYEMLSKISERDGITTERLERLKTLGARMPSASLSTGRGERSA